MNKKDIRWVQRFENFNKSFALLQRSIQIQNPSETERAGIIQFYEISFELGWKVLKDYLTAEGYDVKSPRETIKTAFQANYIADGQRWLDALDDRNLTVHTYDETLANEVFTNIKTYYFPLLISLKEWFSKIISNNQ